VRVKLTLKSASEICVALADVTIAKAGEFQSTPGQLSEAETAVLAFTREIANSAIPLAFYVSGETELGGSAVNAATDRAAQLYRDIEGAFALAKAKTSRPIASALDELLSILHSEAPHTWEKQRDRVNSEVARVGRVQSGYHVKALAEAAEKVTLELLERAFALASPTSDGQMVHDFASLVFNEFADEIVEIAIGKAGRSPLPENAETAERFNGEAHDRIFNKIALWRLEAEIRNDNQPTSSNEKPATSKRRAGRPRGAGAIDDSRHLKEMARLIVQNPALSVRAAAKALEPQAIQPNSTGESTIRRLVGKFTVADVAK
jgi:hypothetical protein